MQEVGDPAGGVREARVEGAPPCARPPRAGGGRRGVPLRGAPWRPRGGSGGSGRGHGGSPGCPRAGPGGAAGSPRTPRKVCVRQPGARPAAAVPRCAPGRPPAGRSREAGLEPSGRLC